MVHWIGGASWVVIFECFCDYHFGLLKMSDLSTDVPRFYSKLREGLRIIHFLIIGFCPFIYCYYY